LEKIKFFGFDMDYTLAGTYGDFLVYKITYEFEYHFLENPKISWMSISGIMSLRHLTFSFTALISEDFHEICDIVSFPSVLIS